MQVVMAEEKKTPLDVAAVEKSYSRYPLSMATTPSNLERNAKRVGYEEGFIAGANWQKEQMMKEAVEADVNTYGDLVAGKSWAEFVVEIPTENLGDKVKIIIVKSDESI